MSKGKCIFTLIGSVKYFSKTIEAIYTLNSSINRASPYIPAALDAIAFLTPCCKEFKRNCYLFLERTERKTHGVCFPECLSPSQCSQSRPVDHHDSVRPNTQVPKRWPFYLAASSRPSLLALDCASMDHGPVSDILTVSCF